MNPFVEECRREWARLRVPDIDANEMAAELEADLAEAEAEGVSAEELLGRGIFDARTFAASWAAERGIVPAQPPARRRTWPLPTAVTIALGVLVVVALVGIALLNAHATTHLVVNRKAVAFRPFPRIEILPPRGPTIYKPDVAAVNDATTHAGAVLVLGGLIGIVLTLVVWWASSRWRRPPVAPA
jgi:hypothetical protein